MYVKRVQLENYGPVQRLDIRFPFDGENPKPVVLVGENGTGKTIVLSHIVNGMIEAKHAAYSDPNSRETPEGRVFKVRDGRYIAVGSGYYFARVGFEEGRFIEEIFLASPRQQDTSPPMDEGTAAHSALKGVKEGKYDHLGNNFSPLPSDLAITRKLLFNSCLLYFPSDRFEEPAWVNPASQWPRPSHTIRPRAPRATDRNIIAASPLQDIQHWLFSVALDRAVLETRSAPVPFNTKDHGTVRLPVLLERTGDATNAYALALQVINQVVLRGSGDVQVGIGSRHDRRLGIMVDGDLLVPNIFQLSSGEVALLGLFLSILRDFDFREERSVWFPKAEDVRGLVVIDEVDMHLHARHQHEVLPALIKMFPRVQFVMTTHSPLFVLGLSKALGEDGFGLYELPSGTAIDPERFSEFGEAYRVLAATSSLSDLRAGRPYFLFVDGDTDVKYITRAAMVLQKEDILEEFTVRPVGGDSELKKLWKQQGPLARVESGHRAVVILHDPRLMWRRLKRARCIDGSCRSALTKRVIRSRKESNTFSTRKPWRGPSSTRRPSSTP